MICYQYLFNSGFHVCFRFPADGCVVVSRLGRRPATEWHSVSLPQSWLVVTCFTSSASAVVTWPQTNFTDQAATTTCTSTGSLYLPHPQTLDTDFHTWMTAATVGRGDRPAEECHSVMLATWELHALGSKAPPVICWAWSAKKCVHLFMWMAVSKPDAQDWNQVLQTVCAAAMGHADLVQLINCVASVHRPERECWPKPNGAWCTIKFTQKFCDILYCPTSLCVLDSWSQTVLSCFCLP